MNNTKSQQQQQLMSDAGSYRRIPLRHIDQINSSVRNLDRVEVTWRNERRLHGLLDIAGQSPTYISYINKSKQPTNFTISQSILFYK